MHKIPVIANGDIATSKDAIAVLKETGADGIAIGRGAIGNPFLFSQIIDELEGREVVLATQKEKIETALLQLVNQIPFFVKFYNQVFL